MKTRKALAYALSLARKRIKHLEGQGIDLKRELKMMRIKMANLEQQKPDPQHIRDLEDMNRRLSAQNSVLKNQLKAIDSTLLNREKRIEVLEHELEKLETMNEKYCPIDDADAMRNPSLS